MITKSPILLLLLAVSLPATAYQQTDVEKMAPPVGEVSMLRGYSSRTGNLTNVCLKPVNKIRGDSEAVNPDGTQSFEYINSLQEMMDAHRLSVEAEVNVKYGLGSAKVGVDMSHYGKVETSVQSGAMWAFYEDMEAPVFANPAADYQLTDEAKRVLKQANKRGNPRKFEDYCGDLVIIGLQSGRYAEGILTTRSESRETEEEKHLKVEAAVKYMGSGASVKVETDGQKRNLEKVENLKINFRTSGDVEIKGITGIKSFRKAFRTFQKQPKEDSRTLKYVYTIAMPDLVGKKEFTMGLSRDRLRKVKTILRGLSIIERAHSTARNDAARRSIRDDSMPEVRAVRALRHEYDYLVAKFRKSGACMNKWSKECQNQFDRFQRFNLPKNFKQRENSIKQFVKASYASKSVCRRGYPISTPKGHRLCRQCDIAKEPKFIKGQEGKCDYIAEKRPAKGSKRLWTENLKIKDSKQSGEAGMFTQLLTYPDKCNRKGKGCGQKAANRLCRANKLGKATAYEVWQWRPSSKLHKEIFATTYADGKACKSNNNSFTPIRCRTFKYIDCAKKSAGNRSTPPKKGIQSNG